MKQSHLLRLQSQKNETQSQKMRLASSHRRPGGLQRKRFLASLMPRRPEQICFSPSTSLDAPNKDAQRGKRLQNPLHSELRRKSGGRGDDRSIFITLEHNYGLSWLSHIDSSCQRCRGKPGHPFSGSRGGSKGLRQNMASECPQ